MVEAFPAYTDLARDERRRSIRISQVLSMTLGLEWNGYDVLEIADFSALSWARCRSQVVLNA